MNHIQTRLHKGYRKTFELKFPCSSDGTVTLVSTTGDRSLLKKALEVSKTFLYSTNVTYN